MLYVYVQFALATGWIEACSVYSAHGCAGEESVQAPGGAISLAFALQPNPERQESHKFQLDTEPPSDHPSTHSTFRFDLLLSSPAKTTGQSSGYDGDSESEQRVCV